MPSTAASTAVGGSSRSTLDDALEVVGGIAERLDGLPGLFADELRSRRDDDAAGLEAAGERYADAGLLELARASFVDAARLHADADAVRDAARAARRAAELARALEREALDGDAPLLVEPLSPRELEIARLAADGRPTRTIAETLFLSSRTVDNHLARVYEKLGIRGRSELSEAIRAERGDPGDRTR